MACDPANFKNDKIEVTLNVAGKDPGFVTKVPRCDKSALYMFLKFPMLQKVLFFVTIDDDIGKSNRKL